MDLRLDEGFLGAGVNRRLIRRALWSGPWPVCGATLSVTDGLFCVSEERSRDAPWPVRAVVGCLWTVMVRSRGVCGGSVVMKRKTGGRTYTASGVVCEWRVCECEWP